MKKKTIIIFGSLISILVVLIVVIPNIFKEEIKNEVLRYVNKNMDLEVTINDYNLSLISNFPRFTFYLEGVKVVDADSNELLTVDKIATEIDSKDLIVDRSISINSISIIRPVISYTLSSDSLSTPPDEVAELKSEQKDILTKSEPESVENEIKSKTISLNISSYEIVGASIIVKDENNNDFVKISNLNHNGYGVFKDDILTLNTVTFIDNINIYEGKDTLLKNAQIKGDLSLDLDLKNKIYSLKENSLNINKIGFNWVGVIKEIDNNYDIDLRFDTPNTSFKDLLAMMPEAYKKDFDKIDAKGEFKIEGNIKGIYNEETMPEFKLKTAITNSYIKYPDLPESIDDINLILNIYKPQGNDFDKVSIDIPSASIKISNNKINASMSAYNLITDPHLEAKILADFDLSKLRNAIPIEKGDNINGEISADVFIKGKMSDLENERYDKFYARGDVKLKNFSFSTKSFKDKMLINNANISITPQNLELKNFDFRLGKSDVKAKGSISKYIEYVMEDKELLGKLEIKSNYFYASDFMPAEDVDSKEVTKINTDIDKQNEEFSMNLIEIPAKINFDNHITIKYFIYGSFKANNVSGNLGIENENAYLKNVEMNTLDGSVLMTGNYSSKTKSSPKTDFDLELKNIDIQKLSKTFDFVKQIAPIIKNTSGKLSSKLDLRTSLDKNMNPVYETMYSNGVVSTNGVSLKNTDFIKDFGEVLNVDELKNNPKIEDINLTYTITKGILTMAPFKLKIEDIESEFEGSSNIGKQTIDMDASIIFPRKYLGKDTNAIIDNAVSLANTFGANVKMGNTIDVDAKISGDITSPKYSLTYGSGKAETPEQYLKQQADKIIEDAKKDQGKDLEKKATDLLKSLFN